MQGDLEQDNHAPHVQVLRKLMQTELANMVVRCVGTDHIWDLNDWMNCSPNMTKSTVSVYPVIFVYLLTVFVVSLSIMLVSQYLHW